MTLGRRCRISHAAESGFRIILPKERLDPLRSRPSDLISRLAAARNRCCSVYRLLWTRIPQPRTTGAQGRVHSAPVMAMIESASEIDWRVIERWSEDTVSNAVEVLLFLLEAGSRRAKGLFSYFSFLSRVAHAFRLQRNTPQSDFIERERPRRGASQRPRTFLDCASSVHAQGARRRRYFLLGVSRDFQPHV